MAALTQRGVRNVAAGLLVAAVLVSIAGIGSVVVSGAPNQAAGSSATVAGSPFDSLDPALAADVGTAQTIAQVFETLTDIDASDHVQPALAATWQSSDAGKRIVFQLRSGLTFSDGTPLRAADVVRSWFRVLDPSTDAPLASLLDDVVGAADYRTRKTLDRSAVGIKALDDTHVEVRLTAPASDFAAIASSPTFAVVPASAGSSGSFVPGASFVGSGGYVAVAKTDTDLTLQANTRYWAGKPAIDTIHVITDIGGKSPVSEFQAGHLDYTGIGEFDASWIAYDQTLGPSLRSVPAADVDYFGFNTTKPPFDNVHVRRAFSLGVDWRSLVALVRGDNGQPATGMVPPDLPGRSATDFGPVFDLAKARSELAAAGYPNGAGFPQVTLVTTGGWYDQGVVRELHDNLGISIKYETLDNDAYMPRLVSDPPDFWSLGWVADYPGANDFLGLLLGTGKYNNYGRWSDASFDAAIARALSASSPAAMTSGFDEAQAIVRDQAPVIPVDYDTGYALSRPGLLGATPNGQGLMRYAGLAWAAK